jgi:hypothetical protein
MLGVEKPRGQASTTRGRRTPGDCALCILLFTALLFTGCGKRDRLMKETRAAADEICSCVSPDKSVTTLEECGQKAWKKYEAAEVALNAAGYDVGPDYAAVHARRLQCQDNITRRQLELVK